MAKSFPNTGATVGLAADRTALASPFAGMQFFETDTSRNWLYNGSTWIPDDMVFTTEALRDAAITSPTEGMQVYLTAPTVPAATGTSTALPTGVQTIYNGSVWVCITPVGADSVTNATTTSTSYITTLTGDGTAISVTLVTGTTALLQHSFTGGMNTPSEYGIRQTFAISGATTRASSDSIAIVSTSYTANAGGNGNQIIVVTSLTAGTNTFTLSYRATSATASFTNRSLVVQGIA